VTEAFGEAASKKSMLRSNRKRRGYGCFMVVAVVGA